MKIRKQNVNWVFWISFDKRDWFCRFWKTRNANSIEFQLFKLRISIGMPWLEDVVLSKMRDYGSKAFKQIDETNKANLNHSFSFLVKV